MASSARSKHVSAAAPVPDTGGRAAIAAVFLVSVAVVASQIATMRFFALTRYHHFSYFIITLALLGFGAAGTLVRLFPTVTHHPIRLYAMYAASVPIMYMLAETIELDIRYVVFSAAHAVRLSAYAACFFVPFFLAATAICVELTRETRRVGVLYSANLVGSGLGGIAMFGVLSVVPAHAAILGCAWVAGLAAIARTAAQRPTTPRAERCGDLALLGVALVIAAGLVPVLAANPPRPDPYKAGAYVRDLEAQGTAAIRAERTTARSEIAVYESPAFHTALFAAPGTDAKVPPQFTILRDNDAVGAMFRISDRNDARIMDSTPQALVYSIAHDQPRVAVLDEVGGSNVWLALRNDAAAVTAVNAEPSLLEFLATELARDGGSVYTQPGVRIVSEDPRVFIENARRTAQTFDVIQIARAEQIAAAAHGVHAVHEDYLLTVDAFESMLATLEPSGTVAVTRGVQTPPRDAIRIVATAAAALRRLGIDTAENHVIQARNYLAVTTIISRDPISSDKTERAIATGDELELDFEWYPGIDSATIVQRNRIDGPEGTPYSYLHHAAREILSGDAKSFLTDWMYDVRPATDSRPYFFSFFSWAGLPRIRDAAGPNWTTHLETGYVVVLVTAMISVLAAAVLIALPTAFLRARRPPCPRTRRGSIVHFALIGFGFMFVEIAFIVAMTLYVGDPVLGVAVVLAVMLTTAGAGSALGRRIISDPARRIRLGVIAVGAAGLVYAVVFAAGLGVLATWPLSGRLLVAGIAIAPVAFVLGWFFPAGVERLGASRAVPIAWAVNGFTSVTAAPLALLIAIAGGVGTLAAVAVVLYVAAAGLTFLPERTFGSAIAGSAVFGYHSRRT